MIQRCTNPNNPRYTVYGGVGIVVAPEWMAFEGFLASMGQRPEETTLGRILDIGNYEPGNVFWMTPKEQGLAKRNKRSLLNMARTNPAKAGSNAA